MASISVTIDTDTLISVINRSGRGVLTGAFSEFTDKVHPGTGNFTRGWEWDQRYFPDARELDQELRVPALFDPSTAGLDNTFFISGIGSGRDLEIRKLENVIASGINIFAPVINHGWYFIGKDRHYLFSDDCRTEFLVSGVFLGSSTLSKVPLPEFPKTGIPIQVRTYEFDRSNGDYDVDKEFRRRINFTGVKKADPGDGRESTRNTVTEEIIFANIDSTEPEFILDTRDLDDLAIIFNDDYTTEVGVAVTGDSDLINLDQIGEINGLANQELNLTCSPVQSGGIEVFTYPTIAGPRDELTRVFEITSSGQYIVDTDLGIIQFGEEPLTAGLQVGAHYFKSVEILYEPENTRDTIIATEDTADTNPIRKVSEKGFVFIKREPTDPNSIELFADLPLIHNPALYGPLDIGSNYAAIKAIVRDNKGQLLEGERVTFFLVGRQTEGVGSFAGSGDTITGITNSEGVATVFYNPPLSVDDIGFIAPDAETGPPGQIVVSGVELTAAASDIYVYKVFKDDLVLGSGVISDAEIKAYWEGYLAEEGIFGPTGQDDPSLTLFDQDNLWEARHRIITGLLSPTIYNRELRNGRKQIVSFFDLDAIDPHSGGFGAFAPLQPDNLVLSGGNTELVFSGTAIDLPTGDFDTYFVIAPAEAGVQASVFNERFNTTILSNEIGLDLRVPPSMNGTVLIDDINDIPAELVPFTLSAIHNDRTLPLGFRIRSAGTNLGSVINGVTYLDINQEPILSFQFTVGSGLA